ncbi:4-hydroxyphenylpyruvate dioxygenase protein [Dioscorea alata]|uniref:4-hydroxyphenylpyruvate dioxygenase protein n=3 Tax=Dioscorea alata TaxID=55571 RepID=A0ACB7U2G6_DIOAL|nr:4-hydroxyphenylpyruvate dioxygenase protein [Dioscorea alata]KAH7654464.1 4-hydroxyphenylpyruvate dioxygenase protein [Dioscorea alata]KAH7654465.1 4-hydroxyphenylpyruvate dioxygenase protein [Dioscorea alata]
MGTEPAPVHDNKSSSSAEEFKLVGFTRFVRVNPRSDRFPVIGFHHVEFWCTDVASAAGRFSFSLGAPLSAFSGLSTANPFHTSHLIRSHDLRFLFTSPLPNPNPDPNPPPIPSFNRDLCLRFSADHGLAVRAIAIRVASASSAFDIAVHHGARPSFPPTDLGHGFSLAELELYGDVVLRLVSHPDDHPLFLPGFQNVATPPAFDYGIRRLDHAVGNVPELVPAVAYVAGFTGFHEFAEFTAEDVGTAESGLNSMVLADNEERVLIPMNEPVKGTVRRSQIQTYLDYNGGPGVQHLALSSDNVLKTLREMRARTAFGGFDFMPPPPPTYYRNLVKRAGDVLTAEQIKECEELGVLVDRDDQGVLLQIFTKPVGDRPTIFLEIIQRIGCMTKDAKGQEYQKGGCGGFGKGNFSELFKSIEEYEKSLEAKIPGTAAAAAAF